MAAVSNAHWINENKNLSVLNYYSLHPPFECIWLTSIHVKPLIYPKFTDAEVSYWKYFQFLWTKDYTDDEALRLLANPIRIELFNQFDKCFSWKTEMALALAWLNLFYLHLRKVPVYWQMK